jgi:hypothetical protein
LHPLYLRQRAVLFALLAVLTSAGQRVAEATGVLREYSTSGEIPEIPWPEWWTELPPPGPATSLAPIVPDVGMRQMIVRPSGALLDTLITWISENFGLPATNERPRVDLVSQMKLATLRYRGLASDRLLGLREDDGLNRGPQPIYAVYDDEKRIIYLPDNWQGERPVEISVLVHELVHHLQNLGGLKYSCPQAREQAAYDAQMRWLELFGKNLNDEFGVDSFDILVRTRCFN